MRWPWDTNRPRPIFLCHGCFDLLHVGHLAHLLEVRRWGNHVNGLVYVSVTADEFVHKGPGRPLMPEGERVKLLSQLKCVDHAFMTTGRTALAAIHEVKPRWYCKGADYHLLESSDPNLKEEIAAVRSYGGDILYTTEPVHHSTDYLQRFLNANRT